ALGLNFNITPRAPRPARLHQPKKLSLNVALKFPTSDFAPAGRNKCCFLKRLFSKPAKKIPALGVALQPVQPKLNCGSFLKPLPDLALHFLGSTAGRYGAYAVFA